MKSMVGQLQQDLQISFSKVHIHSLREHVWGPHLAVQSPLDNEQLAVYGGLGALRDREREVVFDAARARCRRRAKEHARLRIFGVFASEVYLRMK
jgi:hypothetical protein